MQALQMKLSDRIHFSSQARHAREIESRRSSPLAWLFSFSSLASWAKRVKISHRPQVLAEAQPTVSVSSSFRLKWDRFDDFEHKQGAHYKTVLMAELCS